MQNSLKIKLNDLSFKLCALFILMIVLNLLIACSTSNSLNSQIPNNKKMLWQERQDKLRSLQQINLNGSLSYYDLERKEFVRFTLTFKDKSNYLFRLTSPIGTTLLSLTVSPEQVILKDSEGNKHQGNDPAQLIYQLTQLNLPFDALFDLILGIESNYQALNVNANGEVFQGEVLQGEVFQSKVFQNGNISSHNNWHWQVLSFQSNQTLDLQLPKQVELTNQNTKILIKITRWNLA